MTTASACLFAAEGPRSSYLILAAFLAVAVLAGALYSVGVIGWAVAALSWFVRAGIRRGFLLWERTLAWATWPVILGIELAFLVVGVPLAGAAPAVAVGCGLVPLVMGVVACLAYMFIDLERYEVERGYKAVHNPLKGQELAPHLARYGHQADVLLLLSATVATVGGFALINRGLYESVGANWFRVEEGGGGTLDFIAYAMLNLLRVVDVLDLARSKHLLDAAIVRPNHWVASLLIVLFRSFFTLVLLQQIFASIRQGRLLAETIADFWSPHEPIHERARNSLPQYGPSAMEPLMTSLREVETLTREQLEQLPVILATIGPSTIPTLLRHLNDEHEHVRAVAAAALGHLHTPDAVPLLVPLIHDESGSVRQSSVEALGRIAAAGSASVGKKKRRL